jgi:hypothetical protein
MLSSQEFQAKLQAGKIHEALALAIQAASDLDITTRMTEADLPSHRSDGSEYLRTKINLLTGNVENEVGKKIVTDSNNYLKLQQLHIDRVADSHRLVCSYLHQLAAILTALPATAENNPRVAEDLPTRTTDVITPPVEPQLPTHPALDEDLDLSLDRDDEVWEEWVEDEDFQFEAGAPQPQSISPSILPDRSAHSVRRPLNPLPLKPIALRSPATPAATSGWDKFAPEYIGNDAEPQSRRPLSSSDVDRLDDLLTDLDI